MNGLDLVWSAMDDDFETFRKFFEECFGEGTEGFAGTKLSGQMLISAILNKKQETAFYLVNKGAALNVQNEYGDTLIECAIYGKNWEVVKFLLSQGIDINEKVWKGEDTVLYAVIEIINIIENVPK